jgi:hypothetical protein
MSRDFPETMRLKEQADEDIYFAKLDRELIERMHREALERFESLGHGEAERLAGEYREELERLARNHRSDHERLHGRYWKRFLALVGKD